MNEGAGIMTAKEYLSRYGLLNAEIVAKQEQADRIRELAETVSHFSNGTGGNGVNGDKVGIYTAKLVDLEKEIIAETNKLVELKREIEAFIAVVEKPILRQLLTLKYINDLTWEQVAERLKKSWRHTMRLHKIALKNFENVMECHIGSML